MSPPSAIRTTRSSATRFPPRPLVLDPSASNPDRSRPHGRQWLLRRRSGSRTHLPAIVPFSTMTGARHADHGPLDLVSTTEDGSSLPPHLFKTTTEHDLSLPPSSTASPGLRI